MKPQIIKLSKENLDEYINEIVDIHLSVFSKKYLTANFSKEKLKSYYVSIIRASDLSIVSLHSNGNEKSVSGYIISGESVFLGVNEFLRKNRLYVFFILLQKPMLLFQKSILIVKNKINHNNPPSTSYRLLSIGVSKDLQHQGIGFFLLTGFEKLLMTKNIRTYGLSVKKTNEQAIKFYEKNNFTVENETDGSIYYAKEL